MKSYLNPVHGNDATARHGSRRYPWKTYEAAEAALKAAREEALQRDPHTRETFQLVLTHKPRPETGD